MSLSKPIKISLLILGTLIVLGVFALSVLYNAFDNANMEEEVNFKTIRFSEGQVVYSCARVWGISGNHMEIRLSMSPIDEKANGKLQRSKDIVYEGISEVYYRTNEDTLELYVTYGTNIPLEFSDQIEVIQVEFKNALETQNFAQNYKNYGVDKISVYSNETAEIKSVLPDIEWFLRLSLKSEE